MPSLFCNNICFWCSHLECSDSFITVLYFVDVCSWDVIEPKKLLCCFYLCNLLILVFAMVLQTPLMYLVREEIIILYLHSFLSRMSTLSMALQFDEKWNIIRLLNSPLTIGSVELRKCCSYFHWLPTDLFKSLTCRCVVCVVYVC